jgi:hypothetical protein
VRPADLFMRQSPVADGQLQDLSVLTLARDLRDLWI